MVSNYEKKVVVAEKVDPRLAFIWGSCDIGIGVQYDLCMAGVVTLGAFKNLAVDKVDLRVALKAPLALEPVDLPTRILVANVATAWEIAPVKVDAEQSFCAENKLSGLPRPLAASEYNVLLASVELIVGRLEDRCRPSKAYLCQKLDGAEEGEFVAEGLQEDPSRDGEDAMGLEESLDARGQRNIIRKIKRATLPCDSEELRVRYRIMAVVLFMVKFKFPTLASLQDIKSSRCVCLMLMWHHHGRWCYLSSLSCGRPWRDLCVTMLVWGYLMQCASQSKTQKFANSISSLLFFLL